MRSYPLHQSFLTFGEGAARHTNRRNLDCARLEFDPQTLAFTPREDVAAFLNSIELAFFGINQDGRAQRATRTELNLALRPDSFKRVQTAGLRANPRLTLPPGRYQLRVGARDSSGRVGTVFYDLEVPNFSADSVSLSGLLITSTSAQNAMTAQPDPAAPKPLPGPATSTRTFSRADSLTVFAEIYDNSSRQQPRRFDTAVTLIAESGQEVFSARDAIDNIPTDRWTTYGFVREIALKNVPPGRYLLRVERSRATSRCRRQGNAHHIR